MTQFIKIYDENPNQKEIDKVRFPLSLIETTQKTQKNKPLEG